MCRDHPARAVMRTKKIKNLAPCFPELVDFQSKLSNYEIVFAKPWYCKWHPFEKQYVGKIHLLSHHKNIRGRGWNFKNGHYSVWRATFVFQFISGIIQFDTWNHSKRTDISRNYSEETHERNSTSTDSSRSFSKLTMNYMHENWVNRTSSAS